MTEEKIKQWIKEAHENAVNKGFYDCPKCKDGSMSKIDICNYCNNTGIDPHKNIGELLMLIVSELGEALEAHRCGRFAISKDAKTLLNNNGFNSWEFFFEKDIKDTFEDEIADVFIRLFDLCGYLGIEPNIKNAVKKIELDNVGEIFLYVCGLLAELHIDCQTTKKDYLSIIISFFIYYSKEWNIDIEKHITAKMAYNKTRPPKHGKQY
jgi:NTP pyrophosphatase (non-canonical NTP hydrolase)